jgi:tRNA threonylcarbamoyladenosine biosynthesis protein TsaE
MIIETETDMLLYGHALGKTLKTGNFVTMEGPLGAGKTVLCKGILCGLGFAGEVTSPSYSIINRYDPPNVAITVSHIDLYRLENIAELDELGIDDERTDCITLIEWSNRFPAIEWRPTHHIIIQPFDNGTREMKVITTHDS